MKIVKAKSRSQSRSDREFDGTRSLVVIHLILALLIPFIFTQVGGCEPDDGIKKVDVGPKVEPEAIEAAVSEPLKNMSPLTIKLGEAFVYSDTQEIVGSTSGMVVADTSQTVIERNETATEVTMTIIEHKQSYNNGEVKKVSTEIPVRISKTSAMEEQMMIAPSERTVQMKFRSAIEAMMEDHSPYAILAGVRSIITAKAEAGDVTAQQEEITFHRLTHTVSMEPVPELVRKQAGCLGIPNCQLEVHRIGFDVVYWENGKPDRTHIEYAMSPQAPFLAAILDKCATGLASVGSGEAKILVKQCQPVVNFRYVAP